MKQKITLFFIIFFIATSLFAQHANQAAPAQRGIKPGLLGIAYSLSNFNLPRISPPLSDMSSGISLIYTTGLTPYIDFSTRLTGIYHDYSAIYTGIPGKKAIGLELQPQFNFRPLKDENAWAPYLTAGAGAGVYASHFGAYIPVGVGMQFNIKSRTYVFLEAQYKWAITTRVLSNNLFYSLGFALNISGKKEPVTKGTSPASSVVVLSKNNDRDGDSVPDDTDACPDVKGVAALKGCPDSDGDGITDKEDKCPTKKGLMKYDGCPVPDTDNDGINDEDDKCPFIAGVARYQGCPVPDTDNDGINDEEDQCPKVAGVAANMGCPEIPLNLIEKINKAAERLYFATASAVLLPKSSAALNTVVALLKEYPEFKVDINGYTDNQGETEKNRELSEARAQAVSAYLVGKGIAVNRLSAAGFGAESPIADNNTPEGKARNRRVELKIRNY